MLLHDIGSQVLSVEVSTDLLVKDVIASGTLDRRHALNLGHSNLILCFSDKSNFSWDPGGRQKKKKKKMNVIKFSNVSFQFVQIDNTEHEEVTIFWPALQHLKASYK